MSNYRPLVTIVMPAFNAATTLPAAVASVLAQKLTDWELIIVNDGSNDHTRDLLDELTDPRIHVIHQSNAGVSAARNSALDLAQGEFVTFLDADDELPPDSLECRLRYLQCHPEVNIVDGDYEVCDQKLQSVLRVRKAGLEGLFFPRLIRLDASVFFGVGFMVRASAIENLRFCKGLTHCEDLLFLLQAADGKNWRYGAVPQPIYRYRTGNTSAMSNLDGLEHGYLELFEACLRLQEPTTDDLDYLYRRIRRILMRSWLRRGRPVRAFLAWRRLAGRQS